MTRLIGIAAGLVVGFGFAQVAWAGGTLVLAPDKLDDTTCTPSAEAEFEGVDADAFVLGCVFPGPEEGVLLAGSRSGDRAFACFYVVPAGEANEGPCAQVRSTPDKFGGPLSESPSPLTGARGLTPLTIGRYGGEAYLAGWASDEVRSVTVRMIESGSGDPRDVEAEMLPVAASEGERLGATSRFSMFVASIPNEADGCRGIEVIGRDGSGDAFRERFSRSNAAYPADPVPLPGSRLCDSAAAMSFAALLLRPVLASFALVI